MPSDDVLLSVVSPWVCSSSSSSGSDSDSNAGNSSSSSSSSSSSESDKEGESGEKKAKKKGGEAEHVFLKITGLAHRPGVLLPTRM